MPDVNANFGTRFEMLCDALSGIAGSKHVRWSAYVLDCTVDDDGSVTHCARLDDSGDRSVCEGMDRMIDFLRFILGQGFRVEVGVTDDQQRVHFHLMSWEAGDQPEWAQIVGVFHDGSLLM